MKPRCNCAVCRAYQQRMAAHQQQERDARAAALDQLLSDITLAADLQEAQDYYAEQVAMMRERAPA